MSKPQLLPDQAPKSTGTTVVPPHPQVTLESMTEVVVKRTPPQGDAAHDPSLVMDRRRAHLVSRGACPARGGSQTAGTAGRSSRRRGSGLVDRRALRRRVG